MRFIFSPVWGIASRSALVYWGKSYKVKERTLEFSSEPKVTAGFFIHVVVSHVESITHGWRRFFSDKRNKINILYQKALSQQRMWMKTETFYPKLLCWSSSAVTRTRLLKSTRSHRNLGSPPKSKYFCITVQALKSNHTRMWIWLSFQEYLILPNICVYNEVKDWTEPNRHIKTNTNAYPNSCL